MTHRLPPRPGESYEDRQMRRHGAHDYDGPRKVWRVRLVKDIPKTKTGIAVNSEAVADKTQRGPDSPRAVKGVESATEGAMPPQSREGNTALPAIGH